MRRRWAGAAVTAVIAMAGASHAEAQALPGEVVSHLGRDSVALAVDTDDARMALIEGVAFREGVIELEIAGDRGTVRPEFSRAFVGVAFAVSSPTTYEGVYIRFANGRDDDQARRNHTVQYIAHPAWPWERLREEKVSQYESYADVGVGEWTRLRIEVDAGRVRAFINGAAQPALTVPRLRNGASGGDGVAIWVSSHSVGHYRNLRIIPAT